jgi:hypothetical protein
MRLGVDAAHRVVTPSLRLGKRDALLALVLAAAVLVRRLADLVDSKKITCATPSLA